MTYHLIKPYYPLCEGIRMPNGGPLPDCLHCTSMKRDFESSIDGTCTQHDFKLPWALYVFCSEWAETNPDDEGWLDELLDRSSLQQNLMYLWLHFQVRFPDDTTDIRTEHEAFGLIEDFKHQTRDEFLKILGVFVARKRDELGQKGIGMESL